MPVSAARVVIISIFLIGGMLLAGVIMQPEASLQAWDVRESDFPANSSQEDRLAFLIRYAILAPSSHNSQPWKFNVSEDRILIYADEKRGLSVADPDQREMHISLGCALENLVIAAEHFGYSSNITYFPGEKDLVAEVELQSAAIPESDANSILFSAIKSRQTNRNPYQARSITDADMHELYSTAGHKSSRHRESLFNATLPAAAVFLSNDSAIIESFRRLVVQADDIHYSDADYKAELGRWLGQGSLGPTGLQAKAAQLELVFLDMGPQETAKDAELINSTPYIGFVCTERIGENANSSAYATRISAVIAGRTFERFWLAATARGLSLQPMSQALEVQETKEKLFGLLPSGSGNMSEVQQTFRLGYAANEGKHTPRRPLEGTIES
ncbi:MAG: nitroreductase family protein [Methanothrix sp.]|nr:nitroreductase family protein [Methanothrix sp.]